jgi:hypothetical protein
MHEPTFRQALSRSWQLVAQKKSLWIFGILSALIGQMGLSDFVGMMYKTTTNGFRPFSFELFFNYLKISNWHQVSIVLLTLWLLGIILLLVMAVVFIAVCSRGAIIAYAIHWYKKDKILSLTDAWNKGVQKFFPMLVVTLVSRFFQMLVIWLFALAAFRLVQGNNLTSNLALIFVAGIALFLALVIESISIYSSGYLILENKDLRISVKKGLELFLAHVMVSLELGIILMLCSAVVLGIIAWGSFFAFFPSLILWLIAGFTSFKFLIGLGIYTGISLYVAFVLIVAGIFNAFVTCSWIYLFMKMHHDGLVSRVVHFIQHLFRKS